MKTTTMKRFLNLIMLCSIVSGSLFTPLSTVYAVGSAETTNVAAQQTTTAKTATTTDVATDIGKLTVQLGAAPSQTDNVVVKVNLLKQGQNVATKTVTLVPGQDASELNFENLAEDTYTIELSASGYQTYTQTFNVANNGQKIIVYTGFLNGYDYENTTNHPGVLQLDTTTAYQKADLNGDQKVDTTDQNALIDALQAQSSALQYDLNDDQKVDLADLYDFLKKEALYQQDQATPAKTYPSAIEDELVIQANQIQASEQTQVASGNLADLIKEDNQTPVSLKPASEQAISTENPVDVSFDLKGQTLDSLVVQTSTTGNGIETGTVVVELENGETREFALDATLNTKARSTQTSVGRDENGNFVINLGGQIAVKKVTIKVTKTSDSTNLAEISKVEFVNDTQNKIPEPEMSIPSGLKVTNGSNEFALSWNKEVNVSGYEVVVTANGQSQTYEAKENNLLITTFNGKKLVNNQEYQVKVRSVNGKWSSPYSEVVTAKPVPDKKPPKPDNVEASGTFKAINVSWKKMDDTDSYTVYYKEADATDYQVYVAKTTATSVKIDNLKDETAYQVYVVGHNQLGDSEPSLVAQAKTKSVKAILLPKYKQINTSNGEGKLSNHIESITRGRGYMVDSPLDTQGNSANGLADNDFSSYLRVDDWDEGGAYPGSGKGITVKFDAKYKMNRFTFAEPFDAGSYAYITVKYLDDNGKEQTVNNVSISKKKDAQGGSYYDVKFANPITTNQLKIGIGRYGYPNYVTVAEMNFYHYDSLEDDINALFKDNLHLELQSSVTEKTLTDLQTRLDTKDEVSGEYIMDKANLQAELDMAKAILADKQTGDVLAIDPTITAKKDGHLGFASGLNAWQPLGVSANAGDTVTIYVGAPNAKVGDSTPLTLVPTQYYAESKSLTGQTYALKIGKNEITIPELTSLLTQQGGPLYIAYSGNNANDKYSVRISGGTKTATLNLHNVTDKQERLAKVQTYLNDLQQQVNALNTNQIGYATTGVFSLKENIANNSDIQLQNMMLSLPATQIVAGLNSSSDKAQKLLDSLDEMDQMMNLFYQHKGLSNATGAGDKNRLPSQHLNIRYMRMFAGAFMYAGGNHIGIEWDQTPGLVQGQPLQTNANGKYQAGNLFGWGIAHEIGHNINQASYAIAEITNNYFAQLSQARDTNESVRWSYADVFKKTTSNTKGQSSDVFTQLAMYWQLRLAYDHNYVYQTFNDYQSQFDNLFYARVDSYSRNPASAPQPGNIALQLNGGVEQNFMRLASAAAQKDLSEFFTRWGLIPDQTTLAYMGQFEKESRAIYYGDDDAHTYSLEHQDNASLTQTAGNIDAQASSITVDKLHPNHVKISLKTNLSQDQLAKVQGYEISRTIIENGQPQTQVVGFSTTPEYTDVVASINNRVVSYSVRLVDKNLNYLPAVDLGSVKISSDGSHDKSTWKVSTNMTSKQDQQPDNNDDDPDSTVVKSAITNVIDNNEQTTYTGQVTKGDAYIDFDMGQSLDVCGLKFTGTADASDYNYYIQISQDGKTWKKVQQGSFKGQTTTPQTVYFANASSDKLIGTYDARYVRLTFTNVPNKDITLNEIDILGPSGDNVEFGLSSEQPAIFELKEDYVYDEKQDLKIPKGSLIFTGKYKGNPAYNVVLLYDQAGKIVGGTDEEGALVANQIILADVPENGNLGETSDGTFIYWLDPGKWSKEQLPTQVRAELYRVDDALTNEGQRLVADTNWLKVPSTIEQVTIQK